jgi:hypothetical protein
MASALVFIFYMMITRRDMYHPRYGKCSCFHVFFCRSDFVSFVLVLRLCATVTPHCMQRCWITLVTVVEPRCTNITTTTTTTTIITTTISIICAIEPRSLFLLSYSCNHSHAVSQLTHVRPLCGRSFSCNLKVPHRSTTRRAATVFKTSLLQTWRRIWSGGSSRWRAVFSTTTSRSMSDATQPCSTAGQSSHSTGARWPLLRSE